MAINSNGGGSEWKVKIFICTHKGSQAGKARLKLHLRCCSVSFTRHDGISVWSEWILQCALWPSKSKKNGALRNKMFCRWQLYGFAHGVPAGEEFWYWTWTLIVNPSLHPWTHVLLNSSPNVFKFSFYRTLIKPNYSVSNRVVVQIQRGPTGLCDWIQRPYYCIYTSHVLINESVKVISCIVCKIIW